jgi:hypothetical protein
MSPDEIRLECLKLAVPRDIANPDTALVLERATAYATFVSGAGQLAKPAPPMPPMPNVSTPKTGQPGSHQARR